MLMNELPNEFNGSSFSFEIAKRGRDNDDNKSLVKWQVIALVVSRDARWLQNWTGIVSTAKKCSKKETVKMETKPTEAAVTKKTENKTKSETTTKKKKEKDSVS